MIIINSTIYPLYIIQLMNLVGYITAVLMQNTHVSNVFQSENEFTNNIDFEFILSADTNNRVIYMYAL